MTDLRKHARGKPCQVRIPNICSGDPETTVLAHLRMTGITGAGQKAPDALGAHACSACHAEADRVTHHYPREMVRLWFLDGVMRTQYELIKEGLLKW